jgi:hypothetical protein
MPESKKPVEQNSASPLVHPEDGLFEAYANIVDGDWTLTDVTLRFMQLVHTPKEEGATNTNRELIFLEKANITIPWWTAKISAQMLAGLIQAYEKVNGEIKKPELAILPETPTLDNPRE